MGIALLNPSYGCVAWWLVCIRRLCVAWANGSAFTAGHFWQLPQK
jgi:hypothetical protein